MVGDPFLAVVPVTQYADSQSTLGCILIFLTSSAPNKRSLGATNGLAQLSASIMRTIGPAAATSLFSISVQNNWLDGYGVYGVWIVVCCVALCVAVQLPYQPWDKHRDP